MNSLNYYYCISGTVSLNYYYTCTSLHTIINHLTVSPKPVVSIGLFLSTYTSNFLRLSGVAWEWSPVLFDQPEPVTIGKDSTSEILWARREKLNLGDCMDLGIPVG